MVTGASLRLPRDAIHGVSQVGLEDAGAHQREHQQAEDDAVDDERREAAAGQVAQQPGDHAEPDAKASTVARIVGGQSTCGPATSPFSAL